MSPFEAHILIQQATTTSASASSSFPNNDSTETILRQALQSGRLNPNLHFKNESFLSTAIKKGCSNLLKLFLEHGADPNLKSYENARLEPALITAVRYKSLRCVQILLEHGANLSKTNFYGTDAVFQAVHENAFEILDCLLCHNEQSQSQHRHQQEKWQTKDVPTEAAISPSSSSLQPAAARAAGLPTPLPHHQSIIIQKTTTTMKRIDSKGGGNKGTSTTGVKVVLTGEKLSNNNANSSKGHEEDDDHILCPFFYALNYALSYPSKRASLALLLQSYYKCKCLQEIASCCRVRSRLSRANSSIEDDQVKECLRALLLSPPNFSHLPDTAGENKSVPLARVHDDDGVRQQEYYYSTHHHHHVDNENDIRFQLGAAGESRGGRERNEFPGRNLFPYKIYKIQGKCHAIKANESSSLPPSPEGARQRPSSSYVVLVGPLKLSCITREVIRDQIMRSSRKKTCTSTFSSANGTALSGFSNTTVALHHYNDSISSQSKSGQAQRDEHMKKKSGRKNFRQSLQSLTMPSSLMDYILYRNIHWNYSGNESGRSAPRKKGESKGEHENNELPSSNVDNIKLIKRDLELNINYFAIYIY